ncbi:hypothetical protein [Candidatus Sarmatiella mevalonica]|nr:hypothetical protein [Candidatus Sarmatiella mevalonica]
MRRCLPLMEVGTSVKVIALIRLLSKLAREDQMKAQNFRCT